MWIKENVDNISNNTWVWKKETKKVFLEIQNVLKDTLSKWEKFIIPWVWTFYNIYRKWRNQRNPYKNKPIRTKDKFDIWFKRSVKLKPIIKNYKCKVIQDFDFKWNLLHKWDTILLSYQDVLQYINFIKLIK